MSAERDPIDTLREELERVSVSGGFADRVRERITADQAVDLAPIEAELAALTVSAEFAHRVHQRTAPDRRRPRWPWLTGLAAAAIVLLTWTGLGVRDVPVVPSAAAPQTSVLSTPTPRTSVLRTRAPRASVPNTRAPRTSGPSTPASRETAQLEVITNQPEVLAELWAAAARVETTQVVASAAPTEITPGALEIDLATVEVAPVVVKWLVEPPPPAGLPLPFIVRIAAAEAARRPE